MHFALSLAVVFLSATVAFADDILVRADITEATVFLSGAEVTRRATVTIPAGDHRLLIAMPDAAEAGQIGVTGPESVTLDPPQRILGYAISEGILDEARRPRPAPRSRRQRWRFKRPRMNSLMPMARSARLRFRWPISARSAAAGRRALRCPPTRAWCPSC